MMTLIEFSIFVLVGCIVGFLGGLFGVGGGILMVPVLIFSYECAGIPSSILTHIAIGTSLFVVMFTSLSSTYQQAKQNNIHWRAVWIIGFSSSLIAYGTTKLATSLSGVHLRIAFAIVVLFTPHPVKPCSSPASLREAGRAEQGCKGASKYYLQESPVFQHGVRGLLQSECLWKAENSLKRDWNYYPDRA